MWLVLEYKSRTTIFAKRTQATLKETKRKADVYVFQVGFTALADLEIGFCVYLLRVIFF